MRLRSRHTRTLAVVAVAGVGIPLAMVTGAASPAQGKSQKLRFQYPTIKQLSQAGKESEGPGYQAARTRYLQSRYLAGTNELAPEAAAKYHEAAASKAGRTRHVAAFSNNNVAAPVTPPWKSIGGQPV